MLAAPFIPDAAATLLRAMGTDDDDWPDDLDAALATLPAGHGFSVPELLFRKITDSERDEWQARFSGVRN